MLERSLVIVAVVVAVETAVSEDSQRGVPQAVIDSAHTRPADSEQVMCNFFILFFHYCVWIVFSG